jgi:hypothetical protein
VRRHGDEAIVCATHVFESVDGGTNTVYQEYRLRDVEGHFAITDFMTGHAPLWHSDEF